MAGQGSRLEAVVFKAFDPRAMAYTRGLFAGVGSELLSPKITLPSAKVPTKKCQ